MNTYAYVLGNPLRGTDSTGTIGPDSVIGGAIAFWADFAAQYYQYQNADFGNLNFIDVYDYKRGYTAMVAGIATAGASAFVSTSIEGLSVTAIATRTAANASIGAAANLAQTAVLNTFDNGDDNYLQSSLFGLGFGALGSLLGDSILLNAMDRQILFNSLSSDQQELFLQLSNLTGANLFGPTPNAVVSALVFGNFVSSSSAFLSGGADPCRR